MGFDVIRKDNIPSPDMGLLKAMYGHLTVKKLYRNIIPMADGNSWVPDDHPVIRVIELNIDKLPIEYTKLQRLSGYVMIRKRWIDSIIERIDKDVLQKIHPKYEPQRVHPEEPEEVDEGDLCKICLDKKNDVLISTCVCINNDAFCKRCLDTYIDFNKKLLLCPICRQEFCIKDVEWKESGKLVY